MKGREMFVDKSWGRKMSCMKTVRSIIDEDGHDHYNESEVPESSDIIRKEDPYDDNKLAFYTRVEGTGINNSDQSTSIILTTGDRKNGEVTRDKCALSNGPIDIESKFVEDADLNEISDATNAQDPVAECVGFIP